MYVPSDPFVFFLFLFLGSIWGLKETLRGKTFELVDSVLDN